ncbi:MAG: hypothetical protein NTW82_13985 [Bacteroidia bacterium]|nr:hypothetical protein [Bacteroidia bacterium]
MGKKIMINEVTAWDIYFKRANRLKKESLRAHRSELSPIKRRLYASDHELMGLKNESQKWDERLRCRKELSDEEEKDFQFYLEKKRLLKPIIIRLIMSSKQSVISKLLHEFQDYGLDIHQLLLNHNPSLMERKDYNAEINRLKKEIAYYKERETQHFKIMDLQYSVMMQKRCSKEDPLPTHLKVVTIEG